MQKKEKKKVLSDIPTQTKKNPSPSEKKKKHLQTKARPELYREQRARTAFKQILRYKRKEKKTSNFPL